MVFQWQTEGHSRQHENEINQKTVLSGGQHLHKEFMDKQDGEAVFRVVKHVLEVSFQMLTVNYLTVPTMH